MIDAQTRGVVEPLFFRAKAPVGGVEEKSREGHLFSIMVEREREREVVERARPGGNENFMSRARGLG